MTLAQQQRAAMDRAIITAVKSFGTVRIAASALGLPKSTLHDRLLVLRARARRKRR